MKNENKCLHTAEDENPVQIIFAGIQSSGFCPIEDRLQYMTGYSRTNTDVNWRSSLVFFSFAHRSIGSSESCSSVNQTDTYLTWLVSYIKEEEEEEKSYCHSAITVLYALLDVWERIFFSTWKAFQNLFLLAPWSIPVSSPKLFVQWQWISYIINY